MFAGKRVRTGCDGSRRALAHHGSACVPATGSHVNDVVGLRDDIKLVFDDQHRVAHFKQGIERYHEFLDIVGVQASSRLVKYEQGVFLAVAASEEGGQLDALGFPAAQGVAALSEGHITQSDIEEGL